MKYKNFIVKTIHKDFDEVYRLQLTPKDNAPFAFSPGQYVYLKNPKYKPEEEHPFSIASSPLTTDYLEFCIKQYGDWTKEVENIHKGDLIHVSPPQGSFTWNESYTNVVFLLGGLGISPIMSMLRTIEKTNTNPNITVLYGNRDPETIAYHKEISEIEQRIAGLRVIYIFSDLPDDHPWNGYRGFITDEIVNKEVDLTNNPDFFMVGPPIFLEKMHELLKRLNVPKTNIHEEDLS